MRRPQFSLSSLFILTAIVAVGCLVGPPIVREVRERFWPLAPPAIAPARWFGRTTKPPLLGVTIVLSENDSPKLPPDYRDFFPAEVPDRGCWLAEPPAPPPKE
jgi:hypothetical protein